MSNSSLSNLALYLMNVKLNDGHEWENKQLKK